jgi:hypothetical protein
LILLERETGIDLFALRQSLAAYRLYKHLMAKVDLELAEKMRALPRCRVRAGQTANWHEESGRLSRTADIDVINRRCLLKRSNTVALFFLRAQNSGHEARLFGETLFGGAYTNGYANFQSRQFDFTPAQ